jgi:putative glutamine amidotransferase
MSDGGAIHPLSYGADDEAASYELNPEADRWEIELVRAAAARRMPVFGICRGMQIMAVAFGGKLQQEIPEAVLHDRHRVELAAGSACATVYGTTSRRVNASRGQTVIDAGIFAVTARSDGGYIEAIEASLTWPAFGVQWHPERMQEPGEMRAEQALFQCFVDRATAYARARVV